METCSFRLKDSISCLRYSEGPESLIACSSWDGSVHVLSSSCSELAHFSQGASVLSCTWAGPGAGKRVVSGGLDCTVQLHDLSRSLSSETSAQGSETPQGYLVGRHDKAVRCVSWLNEPGVVVSGGWDGCVKLWDLRSASPVATLGQGGKVLAIDSTQGHIAVCRGVTTVEVFDARNTKEALYNNDSGLGHQTRCVRLFKDCRGLAIGCTAGRVAVVPLALSSSTNDRSEEGSRSENVVNSILDFREKEEESHKDSSRQELTSSEFKMFKFKCHRTSEEIFPVNAVAVHPEYPRTCATGGGDKTVAIWDTQNQKRLFSIKGLAESVAALDFSQDGKKLAIAVSYTFENGQALEREDQNWVQVHDLQDSQVRPKAKKEK